MNDWRGNVAGVGAVCGIVFFSALCGSWASMPVPWLGSFGWVSFGVAAILIVIAEAGRPAERETCRSALVDVRVALAGLRREVRALRSQLGGIR